MKKLSLFLIAIMIVVLAANVYSLDKSLDAVNVQGPEKSTDARKVFVTPTPDKTLDQGLDVGVPSGPEKSTEARKVLGVQTPGKTLDSGIPIPAYKRLSDRAKMAALVRKQTAGREVSKNFGARVGFAADSLPVEEAAPAEPPKKQNWWSRFWGKIFQKHDEAWHGQAIKSVGGRGNVRLVKVNREQLYQMADQMAKQDSSDQEVLVVKQDVTQSDRLTHVETPSDSSGAAAMPAVYCKPTARRCLLQHQRTSRGKNAVKICADGKWSDGKWVSAEDIPVSCEKAHFVPLAKVDAECEKMGYIAPTDIDSECSALSYIKKELVPQKCTEMGYVIDSGELEQPIYDEAGNLMTGNVVSAEDVKALKKEAYEQCTVKLSDCIASGYDVKVSNIETTCSQLGFASPEFVLSKCEKIGFISPEKVVDSCKSKGFVEKDSLGSACSERGFVSPVTDDTCQSIGMIYSPPPAASAGESSKVKEAILLTDDQLEIVQEDAKVEQSDRLPVDELAAALEQTMTEEQKVAMTKEEFAERIKDQGLAVTLNAGFVQKDLEVTKAAAYNAVQDVQKDYTVNKEVYSVDQDAQKVNTVNKDVASKDTAATFNTDVTGSKNTVEGATYNTQAEQICCQVKNTADTTGRITYSSQLITKTDCDKLGGKEIAAESAAYYCKK